jgi:hypothetical protein
VKTWIVAIVAMLAVACQSGASSPATAVSPVQSAPSPSPSAATGTGSPVPVPTPAPDLPLSKVDFSCRLPLVVSNGGGDFVTLTGGFVTFPQATYRADPAGVIHSEYTEQDLVTEAAPVLHGFRGVFYDAAMKRWVPTSPGQASPDGKRYAYAISGIAGAKPTAIHIVNVSTGSERVISVATPASAAAFGVRVEDFDGSGVFVVRDQTENEAGGVWRVDAESGTVRKLADVAGVLLVRGGAAWLGSVDPRDPAPPADENGYRFFNALSRLDLATGAKVTWLYRPGEAIVLRGLDGNSRPLVSILTPPTFDGNYGASFSIITQPGITVLVSPPGRWYNDPQADGGRLWFGNDRGIYLYTLQTGLRKVFAFNGNETQAESLSPAGFCR